MGRQKWGDVRRDTGPDGALREEAIKAAALAAIALSELREQLDLKQTEVAARMGTDQGSISRLERREDLYLSTLREYVRALGGELDLVATFPDGRTVRLDPAREAIALG